jgi:hypothetical protein
LIIGASAREERRAVPADAHVANGSRDVREFVEPAIKAKKLVAYVHRILKEERGIVIASRPLQATDIRVKNIRWTFVFCESGLAINVLYTLDDKKKRAVGFKLSDQMDVPAQLASFKLREAEVEARGHDPRPVLRHQRRVLKRSPLFAAADAAGIETLWSVCRGETRATLASSSTSSMVRRGPRHRPRPVWTGAPPHWAGHARATNGTQTLTKVSYVTRGSGRPTSRGVARPSRTNAKPQVTTRSCRARP